MFKLTTLIFVVVTYAQIPEHLLEGLNEIYNRGAYAYYHADYKTAVTELEKALINYKMRQGIESQCHTKCENSDVQATKFHDEGLSIDWENKYKDSETIHFVALLERTVCLKDCIAEHPFSRILRGRDIAPEVLEELETYLPYHFLQFAYHELGDGVKAANNAFTYHSKFPEDKIMNDNLAFFKYHYPEVERMFKNDQALDYELPLYNKFFQQGVYNYEKGEFAACIVSMEKAMLGYATALSDCQKLCFKMPQQMPKFPSFWRQLADMECQAILCQAKCDFIVAPEVYNVKYPDPVARMLSYLQFCYYKNGDFVQAANSAKTISLLTPEDEIAKKNLQFYLEKASQKQEKVKPSFRQDALRLFQNSIQLNNQVKICNSTLAYTDEQIVEQESLLEKIHKLSKDVVKEAVNFDDIKF